MNDESVERVSREDRVLIVGVRLYIELSKCYYLNITQYKLN